MTDEEWKQQAAATIVAQGERIAELESALKSCYCYTPEHIQTVVLDATPAPSCICGEPQTAGTVHRTDGPCYVQEATSSKPCPHTIEHSEWVTREDYWTGDQYSEWEHKIVSTQKDIDLHRFQCTQCGEIGYYSGAARRFYEEGIPTPGIRGLEAK